MEQAAPERSTRQANGAKEEAAKSDSETDEHTERLRKREGPCSRATASPAVSRGASSETVTFLRVERRFFNSQVFGKWRNSKKNQKKKMDDRCKLMVDALFLVIKIFFLLFYFF